MTFQISSFNSPKGQRECDQLLPRYLRLSSDIIRIMSNYHPQSVRHNGKLITFPRDTGSVLFHRAHPDTHTRTHSLVTVPFLQVDEGTEDRGNRAA